MRIKFDPEHTDLDLCFLGSGSKSRTRSRSKSMRGGGFTKAQRCEYMDLCRQMTSRDPAQMTRANRDRLLAFLKAYVIEHSASYPEKRAFIMETIPLLFENPAMLEDPNYLGSYNLVAFQCSILFSIVCTDLEPEDLEAYTLYQALELVYYDIHTKEWRDSVVAKAHLYLDMSAKKDYSKDHVLAIRGKFLSITTEINTKVYPLLYSSQQFGLLMGDLWKKYTILVDSIRRLKVPVIHGYPIREMLYGDLINIYSPLPETGDPLFLINVVDYLYIQELVQSMLANVYYCGFAYKNQMADGNMRSPCSFVEHDIFHKTFTTQAFESIPITFCQKVYTRIMSTTFNKKVRYSILLMLFYILHEDSTVFKDFIGDLNAASGDIVYGDIDRWTDPDDLGMSIPKGHRESDKSIKAYLEKSAKLFIEYFKAVQAIEDPLPTSANLSGSAKKLLNLYIDKEVSVSGSPNINKMKRLLQTRKVAKQAARKSKSRSHS